MRIQTILISIAIVLILSLMIILQHYLKIKPDIGSHLPRIPFYNLYDKKQWVSDECETTIIILFRSKCLYCKIQLNIFRKHPELFSTCRLYFLSIDTAVDENYAREMWLDLHSNTNYFFGIVKRAVVLRHFGGVRIPAIYFYDRKMGLRAARYGLTEWYEIEQILQNKEKLSLIN